MATFSALVDFLFGVAVAVVIIFGRINFVISFAANVRMAVALSFCFVAIEHINKNCDSGDAGDS